ncbi:MAG: DotI/IcmL/TraM family protein [Deltaproteobacteria bacterium]|jgi:intracellular multiplication protein IcmL|nr:DotI/IcmL/TraM family protein [Deltaproteobacteria bacterium]
MNQEFLRFANQPPTSTGEKGITPESLLPPSAIDAESPVEPTSNLPSNAAVNPVQRGEEAVQLLKETEINTSTITPTPSLETLPPPAAIDEGGLVEPTLNLPSINAENPVQKGEEPAALTLPNPLSPPTQVVGLKKTGKKRGPYKPRKIKTPENAAQLLEAKVKEPKSDTPDNTPTITPTLLAESLSPAVAIDAATPVEPSPNLPSNDAKNPAQKDEEPAALTLNPLSPPAQVSGLKTTGKKREPYKSRKNQNPENAAQLSEGNFKELINTPEINPETTGLLTSMGPNSYKEVRVLLTDPFFLNVGPRPLVAEPRPNEREFLNAVAKPPVLKPQDDPNQPSLTLIAILKEDLPPPGKGRDLKPPLRSLAKSPGQTPLTVNSREHTSLKAFPLTPAPSKGLTTFKAQFPNDPLETEVLEPFVIEDALNDLTTANGDKNYTRDNHWTSQIVFALAIACLILGSILGVETLLENKPNYFGVSSDLNVVKVAPSKEPLLSPDNLLTWTSQAVSGALSLNFLHWRQQLMDARENFSEYGFSSFARSLEEGGHIRKIVAERLNLTCALAGTPVITDTKVLGDRYTWKVELPVIISYQSSTGVVASQNLIAMVTVQRAAMTQKNKGVEIQQIVLARRE